MKLAYIILAHNNELHLKRLIRKLDSENSSFFLHIDKKSSITLSGLGNLEGNLYIMEERYDVKWGGFSIVNVEIELLRLARSKGQHDFYILMSGVDYPIKSNEDISVFFENNKMKNFINVTKMPNN
ncbi:beta-1,6-N-acetylglucosaminyltransferase, partial [Terribacillus saccharophilus]